MSLSAQESCLCPAEIHLYIGAITRGAGHVGLCGTYAAVVAVDTVTNIMTNIVTNAMKKIG
jgi:hypothetical protein